MAQDYGVIIVGSGPAGIFCAYELNKRKPELKMLILDKGKRRSIDDQHNNLFGFGGAGAFSDGKLTMTSKTGGQLVERGYLTPNEFYGLMVYADTLYEEFGGKQEIKMGDEAKISELVRRANAAGLELIPYPVKHWGREGAFELVESLYEYLERKGVEIKLNAEAVSIEKDSGKWEVVIGNGEKFRSDFLILSTGRAGADWTCRELEKHGVKTENNPADLGVRMEVRKSMTDEVTDSLHDFKLIYLTPKRRDKVRTFCVCPDGKVIKEQHADFNTVNGQTDKNVHTGNTNFAILVSISFTEPFKDANAFGKYIAKSATLLSNDSILVQTLADWQNERRSKPESLKNFPVRPTLLEAAPGDLRGLALPERIFSGLNEMINALGKFIPGLSEGNNALFYGIEVKFYSRRVVFENGFETKAPNLFVIGDGSGVTRGLLQSTIMGIKTAEEIAKKKK